MGNDQSEDELSGEYEQGDVKEREGGTVADVALWAPHLKRGRQSSHEDLSSASIKLHTEAKRSTYLKSPTKVVASSKSSTGRSSSALRTTVEDYDSEDCVSEEYEDFASTTRQRGFYGKPSKPQSLHSIAPQDSCLPDDAHQENPIDEDLRRWRHLEIVSSPQIAHEPNLESLSDSFAAANLSDIGDSAGNGTDESDSIGNSDTLSEISSLQVSVHERNPTEVLAQQVHSFYATAKSTVIDALMKELYTMLNPEFGAQSRAGHTTENSRDQATNSNSSKRTKTPSRKNGSGKRSARGDNENGQGDEGDDDGSNKRRKRDDAADEPDDTLFKFPGRRFACPFFQRNPTEHKGRACRYPGFTGIHRLKEHLYRCHIIIHCKRCRQMFKTESELENHQRQTEPCQISELGLPEGLDSKQVARLKSKKKFGNERTDRERWMAIYHFLFPDEDATLVSPYCEPDRPISPESKALRDFERFSQREFPRRVKEELEGLWDREAQQVGDRLKAEFMNIVRDCQSNLFKDYKEHATGIINESDEETLATMVEPPPPTDDGTPNPSLQDVRAQKERARQISKRSKNPTLDTSTSTTEMSTRSSQETLPTTVDPDLLLRGPNQVNWELRNPLGNPSNLSDAGDPSFTSQRPPKTLKRSISSFTECPQSASFDLQRQSQKWYPSRVGAGLCNLQPDSSPSLADASDSDKFQLPANHNQAEFALSEQEGVSLDNFDFTWPISDNPFDASFGHDVFE